MPVKSEARPVGRSENKASVELRFLTIYSFNCFSRMAIIIPTSQGVVRLKKTEKEIWEDKIGHGWLGRSLHVEQRKGNTWGQTGQCRANPADGSFCLQPLRAGPRLMGQRASRGRFLGTCSVTQPRVFLYAHIHVLHYGIHRVRRLYILFFFFHLMFHKHLSVFVHVYHTYSLLCTDTLIYHSLLNCFPYSGTCSFFLTHFWI